MLPCFCRSLEVITTRGKGCWMWDGGRRARPGTAHCGGPPSLRPSGDPVGAAHALPLSPHVPTPSQSAMQFRLRLWRKAGGMCGKGNNAAGSAPAPSQVGGHCKNIPTLEYGFLVQIMKYAEQRIPTLNEYCVVCDEQHVFQNGSMLKPAVCTRELCVFSFYTLGVMSGAAEEVATGAEVVDLLVAMCRAALESPRKSIIFEPYPSPYPSVVDPNDPKTLAFNPKKKNYERLQKALDSVMSIREMTQVRGPTAHGPV
uniref:Poly(ADP-ribose) polymerase family member 6 n=1 Tax=Malurus cyaneus samueli TaxID=2593467 RepID=A0A8C5U999_9PASS